MIPGRYNISDVYTGDSWDRTFRIRKADGTYMDLTGLMALAQIKDGAGALITSFTVSVYDQLSEATKGAFMLSLTPAQTAALPVGVSGVWDVEFANLTRSVVYTPVAGTISWTPDVSRP